MYPSSQKAPFERELFGNAGRVESCFLYLPDELCLFGKPLIHRADRRPEFLHLGLGKGGHFHTPGPHIFFGLSFPLGPEAALHIGAVPAQPRTMPGNELSSPASFSSAARLAI